MTHPTITLGVHRVTESLPPPLVDVMALARDGDGVLAMVPAYVTEAGQWCWSLVCEPVDEMEIIAWVDAPEALDVRRVLAGGMEVVE